MLTGSMEASSAAMTAVEVSPLEDKYKGPLRFVVGLAGGVASGVYSNRKLPQIGHYLVKRTQELAQLEGQLAQVRQHLAKAPAGQLATDLARQEQPLVNQIANLKERVDQLRDLGGKALKDAEQGYAAARQRLSDLGAKANADGLSPAARARLRTGEEMTQAQQALWKAEQDLGKVHADIDRQAVITGIARPVLPTSPSPSPSGRVATFLVDFENPKPVLLTDDAVAFQQRLAAARTQNVEVVADGAQLRQNLIDHNIPPVGNTANGVIDEVAGKVYSRPAEFAELIASYLSLGSVLKPECRYLAFQD